MKRSRAGVVLVLVAAALLAGCVSSPRSTADGGPEPSTSEAPAVETRDIRTLTPLTGVDPHSWKQVHDEGYLKITVTRTGFCASLADWDGRKHGTFYWPAGYSVRTSDWDGSLYLADGAGRMVAFTGAYLFIRARVPSSTDPTPTLPGVCPAKASAAVFAVQEVGEPGTPLGMSKRPLVVMECWTPRIRPTSYLVACADAGLYLRHMHYDTWSKHGASGTAVAHMRCGTFTPKVGWQTRKVHFTFGPAQLDEHSLLNLGEPRIHYDKPPCWARP